MNDLLGVVDWSRALFAADGHVSLALCASDNRLVCHCGYNGDHICTQR